MGEAGNAVGTWCFRIQACGRRLPGEQTRTGSRTLISCRFSSGSCTDKVSVPDDNRKSILRAQIHFCRVVNMVNLGLRGNKLRNHMAGTHISHYEIHSTRQSKLSHAGIVKYNQTKKISSLH